MTTQASSKFKDKMYEFDLFMVAMRDFFIKNPTLFGTVHSVKSRLKSLEHLERKLERKGTSDNPITADNLFDRVTDLAGVRVLHLYQDQFSLIHSEILRRVADKDWSLVENPKAYTWDPESESFFKKLELAVERKESFYTSIHYLVRPRPDSFITCEIQVRTLFEEIWGEIDHTLNYPEKTSVVGCREQILVLSKLVGAGTRLADSIFRTHKAALSEAISSSGDKAISIPESDHPKIL